MSQLVWSWCFFLEDRGGIIVSLFWSITHYHSQQNLKAPTFSGLPGQSTKSAFQFRYNQSPVQSPSYLFIRSDIFVLCVTIGLHQVCHYNIFYPPSFNFNIYYGFNSPVPYSLSFALILFSIVVYICCVVRATCEVGLHDYNHGVVKYLKLTFNLEKLFHLLGNGGYNIATSQPITTDTLYICIFYIICRFLQTCSLQFNAFKLGIC